MSLSLFLLLAEAPPSGMSKNGYFFQEMGESDTRLNAADDTVSTVLNQQQKTLFILLFKRCL